MLKDDQRENEIEIDNDKKNCINQSNKLFIA